MGKAVIICSFLMGAVIALFVQLFPESVIAWFSAGNNDFSLARLVVLVLLAVLLVADTYADNRYVRLVSGALGMLFAVGSAQFFLDYPVYLFDSLLLFNTAVCFAIVALQREGEVRELPPVQRVSPQSRVDAALRHMQWSGQLSVRAGHSVRAAIAADEIKDDSHRLMMRLPLDGISRPA